MVYKNGLLPADTITFVSLQPKSTFKIPLLWSAVFDCQLRVLGHNIMSGTRQYKTVPCGGKILLYPELQYSADKLNLIQKEVPVLTIAAGLFISN